MTKRSSSTPINYHKFYFIKAYIDFVICICIYNFFDLKTLNFKLSEFLRPLHHTLNMRKKMDANNSKINRELAFAY